MTATTMSSCGPDHDSTSDKCVPNSPPTLSASSRPANSSFPTSMQATVKIRRALDEEDASTSTVARVINLEPLLSVKMLRMANSAFFNTSGSEVTDVHRALMRVGINNARVLALAVIGDQMATAAEFAPVWRLAEQLWRHTLDVASLAYAIALQLDGVSPDTALLAGMVHDIGQFFLLARVHAYPELLQEQDEMSEFILTWHGKVGCSRYCAQLGTPDLASCTRWTSRKTRAACGHPTNSRMSYTSPIAQQAHPTLSARCRWKCRSSCAKTLSPAWTAKWSIACSTKHACSARQPCRCLTA